MDNDQIVSRMNTYLHTSANVLTERDREGERIHDTWGV